MYFKTVSIILAIITVAVCKANAVWEERELITANSKSNIELSTGIRLTQENQQGKDNSYLVERLPKEVSDNKATHTHQDSYITLTLRGEKNKLDNPLYDLKIVINDNALHIYPAVTGRSDTQTRNRHVAGTEAPLPDGIYRIASSTVPGTHPEVGGRFLPIYPMFKTGRSALGIHYDPSFEKDNGEDGTSGCIALTNQQDFNILLSYVYRYQIEYLEVKI